MRLQYAFIFVCWCCCDFFSTFAFKLPLATKFSRRSSSRNAKEDTAPPVVVLPGFGNADVDYKNPLGAPTGLVDSLSSRGSSVEVLPLQRWEWIRVASGLFDAGFWKSSQRPEGLAYGWYIERARDLVKASAQDNGEPVLLVAHSAGGWLARAVLGAGDWCDGDVGGTVCGLVTLGAPHFPPPPGENSCATRGALAAVDEERPGAFLDSVKYMTVCGTAIEGEESANPTPEQRPVDSVYESRGEGSAGRVAFVNYKSLSGEGSQAGDGVIPLSCAHLPGAEQVTLTGVVHSINEAGTTMPTERWYGSEGVVDRWWRPAMEMLGRG